VCPHDDDKDHPGGKAHVIIFIDVYEMPLSPELTNGGLVVILWHMFVYGTSILSKNRRVKFLSVAPGPHIRHCNLAL
jgi:hypothetical protein